MRISDWSSVVCSSDLAVGHIDHDDLRNEAKLAGGRQDGAVFGSVEADERPFVPGLFGQVPGLVVVDTQVVFLLGDPDLEDRHVGAAGGTDADDRSEEHTAELQSLMRISYAVF